MLGSLTPRDPGGLFLFYPMSEATIRRHVTADPFARVKRAMLEASDLSWKAKGILSYLLGKPDNWQLKEADLINRGNDGRDAVRSGIAELQSAGYLRKEVVAGKAGQFSRNIWHITDTPGYAAEIQPSPYRVSRCGFPDAENPTLSKKECTKNEQEDCETPSGESRDPVSTKEIGSQKPSAQPATGNFNNLEASPSAEPTPQTPMLRRPPLPQGSPGAPKPHKVTTRQRNPLFDALALVCGLSVEHMTKSEGGRVGKALSDIRAVKPDLTTEDITIVAQNFKKLMPWCSITPTAISTHWSQVRPGAVIAEKSAAPQASWQLQNSLKSRLDPLKEAYLRHPANPNSRRYDPDATQEVVADGKAKRAEIKSLEEQLAKIPTPQ